MAEQSIVYASPTGVTTGMCTKSAPCSFTFAMASATTVRSLVRLAPGTYEPAISDLADAHGITVIGEQATLSNVSIRHSAGTLRLHDLTIAGGVISCRPAIVGGPMPELDLDNVQVNATTAMGVPCAINFNRVVAHGDGQSTGGFVFIQGLGELQTSGAPANRGSVLTVDRSTFDGGYLGFYNYSTLKVTNSVITNTGTYGAINYTTQLNNGASFISFSTLYNARILCPFGTAVMNLRNNVIVNNAAGAPADTVTGAGCTHNYELIAPQSTPIVDMTGLKLNQDPRFVNAGGDLRLQGSSPAVDAADPTATLNVDLEGTVRPQGAAPDLGAFEFH
ncbi:MAG: choice-of-anchor Q domain-containing protein [Kofleriaceae bacterium]